MKPKINTSNFDSTDRDTKKQVAKVINKLKLSTICDSSPTLRKPFVDIDLNRGGIFGSNQFVPPSTSEIELKGLSAGSSKKLLGPGQH
jgi:hypothetical protein